MAKSEFVYVTYIRTTPEKLWTALTNVEFMKQYWFGMYCTSDWTPGSAWQMHFADGRVSDCGEIVESDPPKRMVIRWRNQWKPELAGEGDSLCTFEIAPDEGAVRLMVTHGIDLDRSKLVGAVADGWPKVLSNLKSLLETGTAPLGRIGDCRDKAA